MNTGKTFLSALLLALAAALTTTAKDNDRAMVIKRMFAYSANIEAATHTKAEAFSYIKFDIKTVRRNAILMSVPTMYAIAHGGAREYIDEGYYRTAFIGHGDISVERMLERTTIPHGRKTMPMMLQYLTPDIYGETLIDKHLLSPFNRKNRKYYRYRTHPLQEDTVIVTFRAKLKNTQLVNGAALVDATSGRLISMRISGEYDMVRFDMDVVMGERGLRSYYPSKCDVKAWFRFLGNDIRTTYTSLHGLPRILTDSVANTADTTLLNRIRPIPLTAHEQALFATLYTPRDTAADSTQSHRRHNKLVRMLWDNVGDRLLNRIKSNFGANDQGSVRINPLLNPLYFGYSRSKGFVYKFDVRASYLFSSNSMLSLRLKSGYTFKQKRFYFTLPINYYFNLRRNGYVQMEIGNGNRINNSSVVDKVKNEQADSIDWDRMQLNYFNDFRLKLVAGCDLSSRIAVQVGMMVHRRSALNETGFDFVGLPHTYTSVSPMVEIKIRPKGNRGSVYTLDYERSIKGLLGANMGYERVEADWQRILPLTALSSLQMRAGTGFYTQKGDNWIFLDYTNFRDENIPGGWNDDWACSFELLDSHWYNASEYYVRTNLTYESPLLLLSWLPIAGHFMEKERIYVNTLMVRHLHPYMEYGYGFKTRLFSLGVFAAQKNWQFDGAGVRFGFELFRNW